MSDDKVVQPESEKLELVNPWLVPYVEAALKSDRHCKTTKDCGNQYGCSCSCRACEAQPCIRCSAGGSGWCHKTWHKDRPERMEGYRR